MATPRERDPGYEDAGGGFGKFRKRPFRKPPTTPYARPPPAALGAPSAGGWISKLVDPAQKLLTSGAHRFFASVFRKRLTYAPTHSSSMQNHEPASKQETYAKKGESISSISRVAIDLAATSSEKSESRSEGSSISDLESVLQQQTFTRSEIERLTSLLQSRLVDQRSTDISQNLEISSSLPQERKDEYFETPARDSTKDSNLTSIPIPSGINVLPEAVATPTELARAYMDSRSSFVTPAKNSPSRPSLLKENSNSLVNASYSPKSPIMALVSSPMERTVYHHNGFATPRSIGRSALYGMVRTPYSRLRANSTQGTPVDTYGVPSSRSVTLKRRSSVVDNDNGDGGYIRRIRQKSNLLPSPGILSARSSGFAGDSTHLNPMKGKSVLSTEGNKESARSSINLVPSKSSEMASKILQQLDTLVSSREKLPSKLSPSMLRGPALRSLENVVPPRNLLAAQEDTRASQQHMSILPTSDLKFADGGSEIGGKKVMNVYDKSSEKHVAVNGANKIATDARPSSTYLEVPDVPSVKKRAFQMSAREDYFELDEDENANGSDGREKLNDVDAPSRIDFSKSVNELSNATDLGDKYSTSMSEDKSLETFSTPKNEKNGCFVPQGSSLSGGTVKFTTTDNATKKGIDNLCKTSAGAASSPSGGTLDAKYSVLEANGQQPSLQCGTVMSTTAENVTSMAFVPSAESTKKNAVGTIDHFSNDRAPKIFSSSSSISPVVTSNSFSFGASANNSHTVGSFASSSTLFSNGNNSDVSASVIPTTLPAPSPTATPIFKFGLPVSHSSVTLQTAAGASEAAEIKSDDSLSQGSKRPISGALVSEDTSAGNVSGAPSSLVPSFGGASTLFGGTPPVATTSSSLFGDASSSIVTFGGSSVTTSSGIFGSSSSAAIASTDLVGTAAVTATTVFFGNSSSAAIASTDLLGSSASGGLFGSSSSPAIASTSLTGFSSASSFSFGSSSSPAIASTAPTGFSSATNVAFGSSSSPVITSTAPTGFSAASSVSFGSSSSAATPSSSSFSGTSPVTATTGLFGSSSSAPLSSTAPFGGASSNASAAGAPKTDTGASSAGGVSNSSATFSFSSGTNSSSQFPGFNTFTTSATQSSMFPKSSESAPFQFKSSSGSSPSFGFAGNTSFSSGGASSTVFSSAWQSPKSSTSGGFVFGSASASNAAASNVPFTFGSPVATSTTFGNGEQMNTEDSMAEDTIQAATPASVFGQQQNSTAFSFGSNNAPVTQFQSSPFQFGGQQNAPPFQASGNIEFQGGGGSFSLGASGGEKPTRRIVKVKKTLRKR